MGNPTIKFTEENTLRSETLHRGVTNHDTPISKVFAYNNSNVTFAKKGNLVMVNATQMAKPFYKVPKDWLRTNPSKEFINSLSAVRHICPTELVKITQGGNGQQGTWMHEDVAIEFARWLSPAFAIWCNDRIKELLTQGSVSIDQLTRKQLALMVVQAEEEKERLALENKQQADQLEEQRPKVAFADAVLSSPDSILIGELAKILCQRGYQTGEIRLYEQLRHEGYLCSSGSDYNMPMQRYLEMGLFEVTKGTRSGNGGVMRTTRTTRVTQKGCQYFINKFIHN